MRGMSTTMLLHLSNHCLVHHPVHVCPMQMGRRAQWRGWRSCCRVIALHCAVHQRTDKLLAVRSLICSQMRRRAQWRGWRSCLVWSQ
jgi:hypothetical protein